MVKMKRILGQQNIFETDLKVYINFKLQSTSNKLHMYSSKTFFFQKFLRNNV